MRNALPQFIFFVLACCNILYIYF